MAEGGDTITYTYTDGTSVAEDVSGLAKATVEYLDAPGGQENPTAGSASAGSGGRVENAIIDVSNHSTLYIWVGNAPNGRYSGGTSSAYGGGSTEISFSNTGEGDSNDEPFLVGAGGGGGAESIDPFFPRPGDGAGGGGRGGSGISNASGNSPPLGGDGDFDENGANVSGTDGDGAIDDQNRGLVTGGTTTKGGGSAAETAGEIQITFKEALKPVQNVSKVIRGANVELNWNSTQDKGQLEVQRSTDGFQTVEALKSGLSGNASSFLNRGPQRSQKVKYRVVRQNGSTTAESAPVQVELPEFTEVPNPELGNSNKPRFSNIGVPSSASSIKIYKANGVQPVFPDDYTLVEESANGIDKFDDDATSNDSYVSYAFTAVDSNGNESNPDIRQTFVPPEDAAVLRDDNNQ